MWSISQVKQRGKAAFKRNYWKSVLVVLLVTGLATSAVTITARWSDTANQELEERSYEEDFDDDIYTNTGAHPTSYAMGPGNDFGLDNNITFDSGYGDDFGSFDFDEAFGGEEYGDYDDSVYIHKTTLETILDGLDYLGVLFVALLLGIISITVTLVVNILITNPLAMGGSRFFLCNLQNPADCKEICFGFDRNYRNVVKILFFRDLYVILWSLLFLIPGIVKLYEYRMIPYLLAEHPEMSKEEAFAISKQMMMGEKGKAFLLDLSFIGWILLSLLTCGLLLIFYVEPYMFSTSAALYEVLKYQKGTSATGFYRSIPPVTPIPGFGDPQNPTTPPMTTFQRPAAPVETPSETTVDAETNQDTPEPRVPEAPTEDNEHMFEEE